MTILTSFVTGILLMVSCAGSGNSSSNGNSNSTPSVDPTSTQLEKRAQLIVSVTAEVTEARQSNSVHLSFALGDNISIDSAALYIDNRWLTRIDSTGYTYRIRNNHPTGRVRYRIIAYQDGKSDARSGDFVVLAEKAPEIYGHKVVNTYPHSTDAYTQGLLYHNGFIYESTGLERQSTLRRVDLPTGKTMQIIQLPHNYFGEGLTLLNGKLYQLTYKNNKALIYDVDTFKKTGEFAYGGEGWGITNDGKMLYMSDGSERITVVDPEIFKPVRTIEVYTNIAKMMYINELEWINGEIWANIYTTESIIRIDPTTGAVTGVIDMSGLLGPADVSSNTDVFNGIAYDKATKRIFVTGKNWNKLFEVEVFKK